MEKRRLGWVNIIAFVRILGLVLALVLAVNLEGQDFSYTTNSGTITITGYTGPGGAVTVPDTINGLPVTGIAFKAFYDLPGLTSVIIPNGVTTIGDLAFDACASLTNVSLPNSVVSIGQYAFSFCTSLTNFSLPNSVTNIGQSVFDGCDSLVSVAVPENVLSIGQNAFSFCFNLTEITVDPANPVYSSLDGVLFDKSRATLIQCPGAKAGDYAIPLGVITLTNKAFNQCVRLTGLTIPTSVSTIGNNVFYNCSGLTDILIPKGVTSIGSTPFDSCRNLTSIVVDPLNLAFASVEGVLFNKSQTRLIRCPISKVGNYTVTNGVASIDDGAFEDCALLASLIIPNSVTNLGAGAFVNCTTLSSPAMGNGVINIGASAFTSCYSLGNVTLPDTVKTIGNRAFSYCTNLTGVNLLEGLSTVEDSAFQGCAKLVSVSIPGSVTTIRGSAFSYCTSLTGITVAPANPVYSSVDGVLFNKSQTTLLQYPGGKAGRYIIPESVNAIMDEAFGGATILTGVTIPNGVTKVGASTFANCSNLAGVFFEGDAPSVNSSSFFNAKIAVAYYLPGTTGWGATFGGRPTILWLPQAQTSEPNFGVQANQFGFSVAWANGRVVVVEACTNLSNPEWAPLQTNTLTGGSVYFTDPQWSNYPGRFYRFRSP